MFRVEVTSVPCYLSSMQEPDFLVEKTFPANEDQSHIPLFLRAEKEEIIGAFVKDTFKVFNHPTGSYSKQDVRYVALANRVRDLITEVTENCRQPQRYGW